MAQYKCLLLMLILITGCTWIENFDYQRLTKHIIKNSTNSTNATETPTFAPVRLSIASWNLDVFGRTKAQNEALMQYYANKISAYDIIIIQEIRDNTETAFSNLCKRLPEYNCKLSSRAGRSISKEQYGIIWKKQYYMSQYFDFNPDYKDRWERPSIKMTFQTTNYDITVYTIHTSPEDATYEIQMLQYAVNNEGNVIIIGDLNADCDYYSRTREPTFETGYEWIIGDNEDTTSTNTDCAYDRIIVNEGGYNYIVDYGIMKDVTPEQSDHYLIYAVFEG